MQRRKTEEARSEKEERTAKSLFLNFHTRFSRQETAAIQRKTNNCKKLLLSIYGDDFSPSKRNDKLNSNVSRVLLYAFCCFVLFSFLFICSLSLVTARLRKQIQAPSSF